MFTVGTQVGCALPSCHLASELGNPCASGSQLPSRHLAVSLCLELSEGQPAPPGGCSGALVSPRARHIEDA